jgi:hypothetical protein
MNNQTQKKPIEIWVKEDFLIPGIRPISLLMHTTSPDTEPELCFWNLLRDKLKGVVEVRWFNDLAEAGCLVATPHELSDYYFTDGLDRLTEVCTFNRKVIASGRTALIFVGAIEYTPKQGEIVFAVSTYRNSTTREIPTPAWLSDIGANISPLPKPTLPTIGFVGQMYYTRSIITSLLGGLSIPNSIVCSMIDSPLFNRSLKRDGLRGFLTGKQVRKKAINQVLKAGNLKASIVERKENHFDPQLIELESKRRRSEYIQSIQSNAYHLCMRGAENYSFRLYEVMSAGRIPIIIDTNMQLPALDGFGKWDEFSVIVPFSDLHRIGDAVQAFHNSMSHADFRQVCIKSRAAFEYLLPHNFFFKDKLLSDLSSISQRHPG